MKYRHHNQEAVGSPKISKRSSGIKQAAWLLLPIAALAIITYATYSQQGGESQLGQTSLQEQVSSVQAQGAGEPESDIFRNGKAVADRQSVPGSPVQNVAEALPNDVNVPSAGHPTDGPQSSILSGWANTSTLTTWQVADLINKVVTNADSLQRARMLSALTHSPRGPDQPVYRGFGQKFFNAGHRQCSSECTHAIGDGVLHDGLSLTASPPQMTATETLPAGTLIIAMDNALQDGSNNRVRRAYGLAVHLLHADIPLKWIIDPNKTSRTAVDFSASARLRYPTTSGYSNRSFRTGPIAIFPGYEAQAQSVINSYGNGIRVYELQSATTVPVHSDLTHKPKVLVEEDENPDIHIDVLEDAGLEAGTHYNKGPLTSVNANSCVTIITVPHNSGIRPNQRAKVRDFTRNGGNFLAQCAAVRGFQASNPRVFSSAGFVDEPGLGSFQYDNPTEPSAQFEGNIPDEGGSLEDFAFQNDPPGGTRIVHDSQNDFKAYTGRIDGFGADAGGYVHYLGGHKYDGDIDADRYYLNAVLRSADRPDQCGLTIELVNANDDTGTIDCGNASVTINVLANDDNPQGNPLTVSLIGTGSNGTFVNNGDGTVTYTGNVNGFWGGDQITYEACDGSTCDQATVTITSSNPNQLTISGTVFEDNNMDGVLNGGESGPTGATVNLYEDQNNNGIRDAGEPLVQSTTTTAGGVYSFATNSSTPPSDVTISNKVVDNDSWQNSSGTNFTSDYESGTVRYKGYRWTNLNIPANAIITSATVRVSGYSGGGINVAIRAEDLNAPPNYSSANNYLSTRSVTSNSVNWSVPSLSNNVNYTSPDFTSVVQQVVNNNGGLTHLSLILSNTTGTWITWNLDDGVSSKYQRLDLSYTIPGSGTDFVIEVDASTLPAGASFTTPNVQTANFTALGQLDCDNNFGYIACPAAPNAGSDGATVICDGVSPNVINLFDIITGEDAGGTWSETTAGSNSGVAIGDGTSVNFSSTPPGTYEFTYTVTATNCPTDMSTATVTVPVPLVVALDSKTDATCNAAADGTINITASGGTPGYTYAWSDGSTDEDRTALAAGTYTVTVTDVNGCIAMRTVVIEESSDIAISATQTNISCAAGSDGSILVTAIGSAPPFDVSWSGPSSGNPSGDEIAVSGGSYTITGLAAGTYSITVTDNVGCAASLSRTLTEPAPLVATPTATGFLCFGQTGSISLAVSGGTGTRTFSWSGPGGFTATTQNISGLAAGTYNVTVTDANDCMATASATVTGPTSAVAVALDSKTDATCGGDTDGAINITASGGTPGYTYAWSDGPTTQNRSGLSSGSYTVTATDANGCTGTLTVVIDEASDIVITASQTNVSCAAGNDGSILVTATGTLPPFNVSWSGPSNGNPPGDEIAASGDSYAITGLAAGTYSITVTDGAGCTASLSRTLIEPAPLVATPTATGFLCFGQTGDVSLTVTGGTADYIYSWTGPNGFTATMQNISNLVSGTYNVTVTDANNCTATASATVTGPSSAVAVNLVSKTDVLCNGQMNGTIDIAATGGTPGYTYAWSDGATQQNRTNLSAGTYTVTVTDANGCTATLTETITQPALLTVSLEKTDPTCPPGADAPFNADGTITVTVTGGTGPYMYAWSTVDGSGLMPTAQNQSGLTAGTYTVVVTDANGCTATQSVTLNNVLPLPTAPAIIINN